MDEFLDSTILRNVRSNEELGTGKIIMFLFNFCNIVSKFNGRNTLKHIKTFDNRPKQNLTVNFFISFEKTRNILQNIRKTYAKNERYKTVNL